MHVHGVTYDTYSSAPVGCLCDYADYAWLACSFKAGRGHAAVFLHRGSSSAMHTVHGTIHGHAPATKWSRSSYEMSLKSYEIELRARNVQFCRFSVRNSIS